MSNVLKGRTFMCQFGPDTGEEFEVIQEFIGIDNDTAQVKLQHIGSTRTKYEVISDLMNPVYYTETTPQSAEDKKSTSNYEIEVKWADEGLSMVITRGVEIDYQDNAILIYDENGVLLYVINVNKVRYVTLRKR